MDIFDDIKDSGSTLKEHRGRLTSYKQAAELICMSWDKLDIDIIKPYLDDNVIWERIVAQKIVYDGKEGLLNYMRNLFAVLKLFQESYKTEVLKAGDRYQVLITMEGDNEDFIHMPEIVDGLIRKISFVPPDYYVKCKENWSIQHFMAEGKVYQKPYAPRYNKLNYHRQETFDTLFKWVVDKKKRKFRYAKKILKLGFNGYSYAQQNKIIKEFILLNYSDRRFAYEKLQKMYIDKDFLELIEKAWDEFHDEECKDLIVSFFPKTYILKNVDAIATPYNYYDICKCVGSEKEFIPDKTKFRAHIAIVHYVEAVSMTQYPLSESEARELLYRMVRISIEVLIKSDYASEKYKFPTFLFYENECFKEVLVYLCLMGLESTVHAFCYWCEVIRDKCKDYEEEKGDVFEADFITIVKLNFPEQYHYMLNDKSYEGMEWINYNGKIMMNPRYKESKDSRDWDEFGYVVDETVTENRSDDAIPY